MLVNKDQAYELSKKILIGGVSGATGFTITYPLDNIRTILQTTDQSFGQIIKSFNPFRGYKIGIGYVFPENALKLGINDYLVSRGTNPLVSGSIAGFTHSFITSPMELLKIRVQCHIQPDFRSALKSCPNIWRGLQLTLMRDVPFSAIFFAIYENTKHYNSFGAGVFSGLIATSLVTPVDVIKTKYQSSDKGSIKKIIKETIQKDGYKGLVKGIVPRSLSMSFMFGFTTMVFEFIKQFH